MVNLTLAAVLARLTLREDEQAAELTRSAIVRATLK